MLTYSGLFSSEKNFRLIRHYLPVPKLNSSENFSFKLLESEIFSYTCALESNTRLSYTSHSMALLKYFHVILRTGESPVGSSGDKTSSGLPDPTGPLSSAVPSSSIVAANEAVAHVHQAVGQKKRGPYLKISNENKAKIGKYASENGQSSAVRHFSKVQTSSIYRAGGSTLSYVRPRFPFLSVADITH